MRKCAGIVFFGFSVFGLSATQSPLFAFGWHPRFRIGASRVAPVRGGTYFSLQRQRKVGKRKPLQTSGARQDNATAHGL
jgi:hypothetical protein